MSQEIVIQKTSVPICALLGLIFITLKLCGVINWSWWWVTAPFWAPIMAVILMWIVAGIIVGLITGSIYILHRFWE